MKSKIFRGRVVHARLQPIKHRFVYPVYFYALDLDELPEIDRRIWLFGYNKLRPVAIHDKDYLTVRDTNIKQKLIELLSKKGIAGVNRITLITQAKYFNYVFNPVNFYYCYSEKDALVCVVAEVTNTFHETHLYILNHLGKPLHGYIGHYNALKEFFVSPLIEVAGTYDFRCSEVGELLDIWIDLHKDGETLITTQLTGKALPLTNRNLITTLLRYPFTAALNMPRILWQAAILHYLKGRPIVEKPTPHSPMTIRKSPPYLYQKLCMKVVFSYLSRMQIGFLEMTLPDGSKKIFGDPLSNRKVEIQVEDYRFFALLVLHGDIGFGDGFMRGYWNSPDLTELLHLLIENESALNGHRIPLAFLGRLYHQWVNGRRQNTIRQSRKNIKSHYDISNDLYKLFLDQAMTYSCGIFHAPTDDLETAQRNKISAVIRKANIRSSDHVLEIGSGWGSFAIQAVQETGCRVTTITISEEQYRLAKERVREAGLEKQIEVRLCDYRHVGGSYDRIVSIEMLEAVGHRYFGKFFEVCEKRLKPDGIMVLQVITIPDQRYDAHRKTPDWIQKHIFPGGLLPSLQALTDASIDHSHLIVENVENIGPHYATTLHAWRGRFTEAREKIYALGLDDDFFRKWIYYFCYSEAAFASRYLNDLQIVLTRPRNKILADRGSQADHHKSASRSSDRM